MVTFLKDINHLNKEVSENPGGIIVGFFGAYSDKARAAMAVFEGFCAINSGQVFYAVDTAVVKDIHPAFGITSVPVVVRIKGSGVERSVYGLVRADEYSVLTGAAQAGYAVQSGVKNASRQVTVFSTPSCPWCVKVKDYFREKGVKFTDVDISKDEKKAQELVRKSGHTGVPQVKIGGVYVVGFDKNKINGLLGL